MKAAFRERTRGLDIRIGIMFAKLGLTPNTWTVLSLLIAIFGFVFLYDGMLAPGLACFVVSAFLDIVDGNVARVTHSVSNLGAFLDGVVDRYVEFSLYLGLWFYLQSAPAVIFPSGFWMLLLVFGALMPSFITAYADHRNVITDQEKLKNIGGLLERFERLGLIYIGMLLGLVNVLWLEYTVVLVVFLANFTAVSRVFHVVWRK